MRIGYDNDTDTYTILENAEDAHEYEGEDCEVLPGYLIPSEVYDVLKWVGLVLLPALATFVNIVGPAWGHDVTAIVTTITALGTFIGMCIGVSHLHAMGE